MKTKIFKFLLNIVCSIIHIWAMVGSIMLTIVLWCRALLVNNLELSQVLLHLIGGMAALIVGVWLLAYLTDKKRPWMPYEPVNNNSCWPKANS